MRTYAVGDVHGMLSYLQRALEWIESDADGEESLVVFLGDYIDRGPDSAGVVALLMAGPREYEWMSAVDMIDAALGALGVGVADDESVSAYAAERGWEMEDGAFRRKLKQQWVCLKGNHEDMLVGSLSSDDALKTWWGNGGVECLESYKRAGFEGVPQEHLEWMAARPLLLVRDGRAFVHAMLDTALPPDQQRATVMLWGRERPDTYRWHPMRDADGSQLLVVHGHTPSMRHPDYRPGAVINIDTGSCFGGRLTVAAWRDGEAHPRLHQVNEYVSNTLEWRDAGPASGWKVVS